MRKYTIDVRLSNELGIDATKDDHENYRHAVELALIEEFPDANIKVTIAHIIRDVLIAPLDTIDLVESVVRDVWDQGKFWED